MFFRSSFGSKDSFSCGGHARVGIFMPVDAARAASFPLTQSVWLAVARHMLGLDAEGGESLAGAPEGAVLALERGPTLHVMGAVGEAALGKANQARLAPARAGGLLMAMAGLWRDARLHKEDKARYKAMYRGAHGRPEVPDYGKDLNTLRIKQMLWNIFKCRYI